MSRSLRESSLLNTTDYRSLSVGVVPSNEYLIATTVVGATPAASIDLDVSAYAGIYKHLQLRITAKTSSGTGSSGNNRMMFNSDTGANYSWHRLRGAGDESTPASQAGSSQSAIDWGFIPRDNSGNGSYAGYVIDILDPFDTTKYTTTRCLWGFWQSSVEYVGLNSGLWMNTNALTSISFEVTSYSYATGSRFSVYGVTA